MDIAYPEAETVMALMTSSLVVGTENIPKLQMKKKCDSIELLLQFRCISLLFAHVTYLCSRVASLAATEVAATQSLSVYTL